MKKFLALLVVLAVSLFSVSAFAYDVKVDDDTYAKVGFKGQIWYQNLKDAAPNGSDANGVAIKQIRVYASGQITNLFKFGTNIDFSKGNTDKAIAGGTAPDATGKAGVTDGFVTFDLAKEAKVMVGIYRMAVSRIALQDSYTYMTIHAPAVGSAKYLSNQNNYRSAGVTVWGDLADGMVRYNVGVWDGTDSPLVTSSASGSGVGVGGTGGTMNAFNAPDRPAYSARVAVNLWDPEKGYTNSCCYLGKAKILTIGAGYLDQGFSGSSGSGHYTVATADVYLAMDPITAEAGYFKYDFDQSGNGTKPTGYYAQVSFRMDKIEPAFRYEKWDADNSATMFDYKRYVAGINYYIDGHDAKISLERLAHLSDTTAATLDRTVPETARNFVDWTLQLQFQF